METVAFCKSSGRNENPITSNKGVVQSTSAIEDSSNHKRFDLLFQRRGSNSKPWKVFYFFFGLLIGLFAFNKIMSNEYFGKKRRSSRWQWGSEGREWYHFTGVWCDEKYGRKVRIEYSTCTVSGRSYVEVTCEKLKKNTFELVVKVVLVNQLDQSYDGIYIAKF